ncbi:hypothetical protein Tco_0891223 [Tanacetum coccineum]|uniref:Uncharacterized protein n=1 Tax=Tanacetum coccineum TaxID=301880 RepID=A0ABQ5C5N8_9ASTR
METKDSLPSCSDSEGKELEQMHKEAHILKESSMTSFKALKTTIQRLTRKDFLNCYMFKCAFPRLFDTYSRTFKLALNDNMDYIEAQLHQDKLHKTNSMNAFKMLKTPFQKFFHSVIKSL